MRRILLALAGAAALIPGASAAQRRTVDDGPRPVPNVRIQTPGAMAGTRREAPERGFDDRCADVRTDDAPAGVEPMRVAPLARGALVPQPFMSPEYTIADYGDYGLASPARGSRWVRHYDDALLVDGYGRVRDVASGTFDMYRGRYAFSAEDRDADYPDRLIRDDDGGGIAYDRDYPYEYPYGGEGIEDAENARRYPGGYTVTETIVTTVTPDTVRRARPGEVASTRRSAAPRRAVRRRR